MASSSKDTVHVTKFLKPGHVIVSRSTPTRSRLAKLTDRDVHSYDEQKHGIKITELQDFFSTKIGACTGAPAGATGTTRVKGVVMLKFANPNDAARAAGIDEAEIMVEKVETKGKDKSKVDVEVNVEVNVQNIDQLSPNAEDFYGFAEPIADKKGHSFIIVPMPLNRVVETSFV